MKREKFSIFPVSFKKFWAKTDGYFVLFMNYRNKFDFEKAMVQLFNASIMIIGQQ